MSEQSEIASLETMLDGGATPKPDPATERVETAPESSETGEKPETAAPPAEADESDNSPLVPRKALIEERRKRQDFEKKVAEFEAKLAELSKPQPPPQQQRQEPLPPPDPWTDPEGAIAYERQQRALELYETRVILSEEMMSQKPDYQEAKQAFLEGVQANPMLAQQLVRHPMPAKFVYEQGKRLAAMKEIGPDPASWREAERQRLRDELLSEMQAQQPSQSPQAPKAPAPKSLAGQTSSVPRDPHGRYAPRNGPTPLEDIIG